MRVVCQDCGSVEVLTPSQWRCTCGGPWEPRKEEGCDTDLIDTASTSVWRYRRLFSPDLGEPTVRLGAGWTPLLEAQWGDRRILLKLEYLMPTGSFKDRGTEVMINLLAAQGVTAIVDDSSGNAGASVAAYAARAGMRAQVFVPGYASPSKQQQIAAYGARVSPVPGPRDNARREAEQAAESGWTPAFHSYHPGFLLGQSSVAWEVWEQLGFRTPDWYVVPVGQGVHLLGVWMGFRRLHSAGLIPRMPRLVAVQARAVSPLCEALERGGEDWPDPGASQRSVAEGVAIQRPVRWRRLLQVMRESGGFSVSVGEREILEAQERGAHCGFYVEPTSATVLAALDQIFLRAGASDHIVVPLTGSGLKGSPAPL